MALVLSRFNRLSHPLCVTRLFHFQQCHNISGLSKHAQYALNSNPELQHVIDELDIPGKFQKHFFPSKRQLKRDAMLSNPPKPRKSMMTELWDRACTPRHSKRKSYRISRAIHEILYDPALGVAGATSPSWRVNNVEISTTGDVTVWWVPADDINACLMLDNEYHVHELETLYQSIKSALQARLKIKGSQLPKITFIRKDTSLSVLLDIVADECEDGSGGTADVGKHSS